MRLLFLKDFLDLIFPRNCPLCAQTLLESEDVICLACLGQLPVTSYHLRSRDNDLKSKIAGLTRADQVMAYLKFTKSGQSQQILHLLKYRNKPEIARLLGKNYAALLFQQGTSTAWDVLVPVPLHPIKHQRRGYNQSEEFAKGLGEGLAIPMENLIKRAVFTETQTKKSRLERLQNVEDVFQCISASKVSGKSILLVDDVITTGATLCACANVLWANGAKNVDLVTIAAGGKI